jgi:hypothetical protein
MKTTITIDWADNSAQLLTLADGVKILEHVTAPTPDTFLAALTERIKDRAE